MPINAVAYQSALELRRTGASYSEIHKKLGIPKSTLSGWFAKMQWSAEVTTKLNMRWSPVCRQKILRMNGLRLQKHHSNHERMKENARREFSTLMKNPLFPIGLSLYWGEGQKRNQSVVGVINSDVQMLQLIARFYREVLHVTEEKLRIALFIYADEDESELKDFWSRKLQLSPQQFIKTQILPSRSTRTKKKVPHGMCNLHFSSVEMHIKILQWIELLATTYAGIAQW